MKAIDKIGLLAGEGRLPAIFAEEARKKGAKVVAFAAKGLASPELKGYVDKMYWVDLANTKKLPFMILTNKIRKLVMLGKVPKSLFFKKDFSKSSHINSLLKDTKNRADDSVLREVSSKAKKFGITFISPADFLSDYIPKKGTFTKREPTAKEWEDIEFGKETARVLGKLDIGQTVVVQNKAILAVEAIEGTDEAIRRGGQFSKGGMVVVKMMKPNQDPRFDIPAVGTETINSLMEAGAAVLAMEAGKTFFIDREEATAKADKHGVSIVAI